MTCRVPQGVGGQLTVQMGIAGQRGQYVQTASYQAPVIARITPQSLPTVGSSLVTIQGTFFGYFDSAGVAAVGLSLCSPTSYVSDTSISCKVQSGVGGALNVTLQIGGQTSVLLRSFSYLPPQLYYAFPTVLNTTGGVLTVTGVNFGYAVQNQKVFVGSTACSSASMSPWISGIGSDFLP